MKKYLFIIFPVFLTIFLSCKTISNFDQYAYIQATSLKVDALNLMEKATTSYNAHIQEISPLKANIEKAYEYEKHRPKNEITTKMWQVIKDTSRNLLGGFLTRWQTRDSLSAAFVNEAKVQVGEAFDLLIELESKKIKPSDSRITNFLSR